MAWLYAILGVVVLAALVALFALADWLGERRAARRGDVGEPDEPSRAWLKGPF